MMRFLSTTEAKALPLSAYSLYRWRDGAVRIKSSKGTIYRIEYNDVLGLRYSTDGSKVRMVLKKEGPTIIFTLTDKQVERIQEGVYTPSGGKQHQVGGPKLRVLKTRAIKKDSITPNHIHALDAYQSSSNKKTIAELDKYTWPAVFRKAPGLVFRGMGLKVDVVEALLKGKRIKLANFSSWSRSSSIAEGFASNSINKEGVIFKLKPTDKQVLLDVEKLHLDPRVQKYIRRATSWPDWRGKGGLDHGAEEREVLLRPLVLTKNDIWNIEQLEWNQRIEEAFQIAKRLKIAVPMYSYSMGKLTKEIPASPWRLRSALREGRLSKEELKLLKLEGLSKTEPKTPKSVGDKAYKKKKYGKY